MNLAKKHWKVSKLMSFVMVLFICMMVVIALSLPLYAATLDQRVITDNDDAEENIVTGGMYLDNTDLEMIYDSDGLMNQLVGVRFTNISVPKGATITTAYIQFTTDEVSTGNASLVVSGEAADNPPAFSGTSYNISSRFRTTAQVNWTPAEWNIVGEAGLDQRTSELKTIVQEIVDRPGWASGNAMAFIITGNNGNRRCAESYLGDSSQAPLLHIEWSLPPTPTPTITVTPTPTVSPTPTRIITITPTPIRVTPTPTRIVSVTPTPTWRYVTITPTPTYRIPVTPSRPITPPPTFRVTVIPTPTRRIVVTPTPTPTPIRVTPTPTERALYHVYYGHLHNHSYISDGTGTPSEAYAYARDVAKLDFFSLADHSDQMDDTEWTGLKNTANAYNQDGTFVTFWGFEWSSWNLGHVAVINAPDYCSAYSAATDTFLELLSWLSTRDCVAFFNHPGRQDSTAEEFSHFTTAPSTKLVGMELWNKGETYNSYYYNDGYYSNDGNKGCYDEAITRNWKIGAAGSDDNHTATWGTDNDYRVAVWATDKTRAAIYEAFQARRFYSTLDKNLVLSFMINSQPMGSSINAGTYTGSISASDGNNEIFTSVELIKNGTMIYSWTPNQSNPDINQSLTCAAGDYFYVRVRQADGNEAISSPIFVNP